MDGYFKKQPISDAWAIMNNKRAIIKIDPISDIKVISYMLVISWIEAGAHIEVAINTLIENNFLIFIIKNFNFCENFYLNKLIYF